ncbi:MAG TPA: hypothetical protein VG675_23090 [Bryobacteraceae bacterium]|nr:hypothetical protein [Bryobacteraceae bacterium]
MKPIWVAGVSMAALALSSVPALAQAVISARSGEVSYIQGQVDIDGQKVESSLTRFPQIKENSVLHTAQGRAEVLLTPGVFLRVGENSSFRLLTDRFIDTRLELLTGSAVVEADEIAKDTNLTIVVNGDAVALNKAGVYHLDTQPARIKVYSGQATVKIGEQNVEVGSGKMLNLSTEMAAVEKFDRDDTDSLDRWSKVRGGYVAMANVSSAKSLRDSGTVISTGAWQWNPWFGMVTFIPAYGRVSSPYGYAFWSPYTVGRVFYVPPRPNFGNWDAGARPAYTAMPPTMSGNSGTMAVSSAAPSVNTRSTAPAAAPSAPIGRGSASGGGHQR